jgi:hypothetical protein
LRAGQIPISFGAVLIVKDDGFRVELAIAVIARPGVDDVVPALGVGQIVFRFDRAVPDTCPVEVHHGLRTYMYYFFCFVIAL